MTATATAIQPSLAPPVPRTLADTGLSIDHLERLAAAHVLRVRVRDDTIADAHQNAAASSGSGALSISLLSSAHCNASRNTRCRRLRLR